MKAKFPRRNFLKMALLGLGSAFLDACGRLVNPAPTALPPLTVTPSKTVEPLPTITSTPEPADIPIYKNSFEDIINPAASGITSSADITINTENFNYPGGGTALEIKGLLQGAQYSSLNVDFSITKLTGQDSLDLTNKTIYYSAFIPADSAIDNISVYAGKGTQFVSLASITRMPIGTKAHGTTINLTYRMSRA